MSWVVVKLIEHGSLVCVSGEGVEKSQVRGRSGVNLNLFFFLFIGSGLLGKSFHLLNSSFPIYKMRTLILTLEDFKQFKYQTSNTCPSPDPSRYLVNTSSPHCYQRWCAEGVGSEQENENMS